MGVLGGAFAQLRLEDETARGSHLCTASQAFDDFHVAAIAATERYRCQLKTFSVAYEDRGFVLNRLNRRLGNADRHAGLLGGDFHRHEQAGTPGTLRVGKGHAHGGSASLLAQQAADVTNLAFDPRIQIGRADDDRTTSMAMTSPLRVPIITRP